jgi:hypothetical protein
MTIAYQADCRRQHIHNHIITWLEAPLFFRQLHGMSEDIHTNMHDPLWSNCYVPLKEQLHDPLYS